MLITVLAILSLVLMECKSIIEISLIKRLIEIFFKTMKYICFIGLGCLLSYVYQKKITTRKAFIYSLILTVSYFGYFVCAGNYAAQRKEIMSYSLAYILFTTCYALRENFLKQGIMAYMGNISYSLYLVHGVPGFVMIYWLMSRNIKLLIAIATTIGCLFLVTIVFYRFIESNFTPKK